MARARRAELRPVIVKGKRQPGIRHRLQQSDHDQSRCRSGGGERRLQPKRDNQPEFAEPPPSIEGEAPHYNHYADDDHCEQPVNLFLLMTPAQQRVLFARLD